MPSSPRHGAKLAIHKGHPPAEYAVLCTIAAARAAASRSLNGPSDIGSERVAENMLFERSLLLGGSVVVMAWHFVT